MQALLEEYSYMIMYQGVTDTTVALLYQQRTQSFWAAAAGAHRSPIET